MALTHALPALSSLLAVDFFNQINMLYGTITEFCTPQECKVMSAGAKYVPRSRRDRRIPFGFRAC